MSAHYAAAVVDRLLSPDGQHLLDRIAHAAPDPGTELALATSLRREYPAELVSAALAQYELRVTARAKFADAQRMLFTRAGLEQASGDRIAAHRAVRLAPFGRVGDLCCGIGGDLMALVGDHPVIAVDLDPIHLRIAAHNARVRDPDAAVHTVLADVRDVDLHGVEAVFVDPARRRGTRRMRAGDGEPPLSWCTALTERIDAVAVKASPALPRELVPAGWEVEFVAEGRDLKEATLWSPALATTPARASMVHGDAVHTLAADDGPPIAVTPPSAYLLDPSAAVTRAGLVQTLARRLDLTMIDERIAFLTGDRPVHTPFGRTLRVLESLPWQEKRLAARLRELGTGAVDVRRRGLAGDVDALTRRLAATGRGGRAVTVVMTRVRDRPWALICVTEATDAAASSAPDSRPGF